MMKKKGKNRAAIFLMLVGYLCVAFALALFFFNLWDENRARSTTEKTLTFVNASIEQAGRTNVASEGEANASLGVPVYKKYPQMEMPSVKINQNSYIARLDIPSLDLSLPVMEEFSSQNLKLAPCRAEGSVYQGNMVIASNSYKCHLGNLRQLEPYSPIYITDMDGNCFSYEAVEIEKMTAQEIKAFDPGDWDLTLISYSTGRLSAVVVRCVEMNQ